ncbi:hypothetical protein CBS147333_1350 [Penicillium roqueforti]|nr:hypothetical protein CBS147333_1350 [Penicillium roqueforti]KAI3190976.1 hypothetical protein CBS147311_9666 [Penicillium roqueforti]KAI3262355.1 hypothetical protein CBS147308_9276 [Penicillium roqueforti]
MSLKEPLSASPTRTIADPIVPTQRAFGPILAVHSHRVLDNRITQSLLALRNRDHPQGKHRSHRDRVHILNRRL